MDNKIVVMEQPPIRRIKVKIIGVTELITHVYPMKSRVMID